MSCELKRQGVGVQLVKQAGPSSMWEKSNTGQGVGAWAVVIYPSKRGQAQRPVRGGSRMYGSGSRGRQSE